MAALRSTALAHADIISSTPVVLYTVPTGKLVILKSVVMLNLRSSAVSCIIGANGIAVRAQPLDVQWSAGANFEWRPWLAVPAGNTIRAWISPTGGDVTVTLSGSILYV